MRDIYYYIGYVSDITLWALVIHSFYCKAAEKVIIHFSANLSCETNFNKTL